MARDYEQVTPEQFSQTEGIDDWRVVGWHACALFRTGSFLKGLELAGEIGRLAEEADHHPDLNLRYPVLEVRLSTHDTGSLTTADVSLAQQISAAARNRGIAADPDGALDTEIARAAAP